MVEVVNKPKQYLEYMQKQNIPAVAFTEHGNIHSWVSKKQQANKLGLKYIHGVEMYITDSLDKKVRDNYHLILLAKNYDGVQELNELTSISYNGRGQKGSTSNQFYYRPRVSFEQVSKTSDNIIILTACLGSPLWQHYKANNVEWLGKWLGFFRDNRHRVWLEVQPHNDPEQKLYNAQLVKWSEEYGMKLVASNDVHALDKDSDVMRKILMGSKDIEFEDDKDGDGLELWLKNYDEMVSTFEKQGVLTAEQIVQALDETHVIADSVEDFEFDMSFKYPKIFPNSDERFKRLINAGYKSKGINKLPKEELEVYQQRVLKELKVYRDLDTVDYLLLMEHIIGNARQAGRHPGPARGSVAGSLIAYLLGIIEVDPVKEDLSFERFMNPDRVSLADQDVDWHKEDREWVAKFMFESEEFETASIVTFNTLQIKGAIKDIGRAMGYPISVTEGINARIVKMGDEDVIPHIVEEEYPELVQNAYKVLGVITSVGRHAGGFIVTTRDISKELGVVRVDRSPYPVSSVSMKEVEGLFYVKLDMLGVDNIGLINKTCELAGIPRITPQSTDIVDFNDRDVINSMRENTVGIFQFGEAGANDALDKMFSEESEATTLKSGGELGTAVNRMAFLSAGIRPGAKTKRHNVISGIVEDNGHEALNDMLKETNGMLIYQESIIQFLVKFCSQTPAQADVLRRAIGKKQRDVMEEQVPKIKEEFVKTLIEQYGDDELHSRELAETFFQILYDASDYSFSKNHAVPYSYVGYISGWLRYYYPLEFLTTAFNIWGNKPARVREFLEYAESEGIKMKPVRFRYSRSDYFFSKETNSIYEGTDSIKGGAKGAGDLLYQFKDRKFDTFTDFLITLRDDYTVTIDGESIHILDIFKMDVGDIKALDKQVSQLSKSNSGTLVLDQKITSVNKTTMLGLIYLGYFEEFGEPSKLEKVFTEFDKGYKAGNKTFAGKAVKYHSYIQTEQTADNTPLSLYQQAEYELQYLNRISIQNDAVSGRYAFVADIIKVTRSYTLAKIHNVKKGMTVDVKVGGRLYQRVPFQKGDLIEIISSKTSPKTVRLQDGWGKHPTERELWVNDCRYIRKSNGK